MQTVAIVGVGLIGSSFGLALRKAGFTGEILGVSSKPALEAAKESGAISAETTLAVAARQADLIYLSQPVDRILKTLERLGPLIEGQCLVTDAGSTKASIVAKAAVCLPPGTFLGGHPMAGKETSGAAAGDAGLFKDRLYLLTPLAETDNPIIPRFKEWLARIGAHIKIITPEEHDRTVAFTSHLPQLLSTTLAAALQMENNPNLSSIFGPGLMDLTRLALSPLELWSSILSENKQQVLAALDTYIARLIATRASVSSGELDTIFVSAQTFARQIRKESR